MDLDEGWRVHALEDEPLYCDATCHEDEVLYAGSDDEHYDSREEKKQKYEAAAHRFLSGHMPILLTSILKGPFEGPEAKGWVNPWASKSKAGAVKSSVPVVPVPSSRTVKAAATHDLAAVDSMDTDSTTSCHLPSPRSLDQPAVTPHPFMEEEDADRIRAWRSATESASQLDDEPTWSFAPDVSLSPAPSQRKRRSMGSDWLKRKDTKRRKAEDEEIGGSSTAAQQQTPSLRRSHTTSLTHGMLDGSESLPSSASNLPSSQRPLQKTPKRPSRRSRSRISKTPVSIAEDNQPPPFSTPIQTPQSIRISRTTPSARKEGISQQKEARTPTDKSNAGPEIKVEFETQEDESFLFRARPRSREHVNIAQPLASVEKSSPLASAQPSGVFEDTAGDLDGDTYMADDTKATSPESTANKNETMDDDVEDQGTGKKGLILEVAADTPPAALDGDSEMVKHISVQSPQDGPHEACRADETGGDEEFLSASQEPTIVVHAASQEQEEKSPKKIVPISSPVDMADERPTTSPLTHQQVAPSSEAAQRISQQSPWSKADHFTSSSPCPGGLSTPKQLQTKSIETPVAHHDNMLATPLLNQARSLLPLEGMVEAKCQRADEPSISPSGPLEDASSAYNSPAVPASQQSPWKVDLQVAAPPVQLQVIYDSGNQSFLDPNCQSPWTKAPSGYIKPHNSTLMSQVSYAQSPVAPTPFSPSTPAQQSTPTASRAAGGASALSFELQGPVSTPLAETPRSSSPTPIFPIKPFANFMSPSPEKSRRPLNEVSLSGGHLPSTQNLLAATTDNPWDITQKPAKKTVTFAPLPDGFKANGELEDEELKTIQPHQIQEYRSRGDEEPTTPKVSRVLSPPPPDFTEDDLDGVAHKKHFQLVSSRIKLHQRLLPSASQQVPESPAPMAMAEAFVTADSLKTTTPQTSEAAMRANDTTPAMKARPRKPSVDDVDDVLCNLNEFIGMVTVEAELAQAKEDERKENERRQHRDRDANGGGFSGAFPLDGIMDARVWD